MEKAQLQRRLANWGDWLLYDCDIGPEKCRCVSIESTHIPEAGDVWEADEPSRPIPDVADAEAINKVVRQLDRVEVLCLSLRYGGIHAVFRMRRISEHVQNKIADNAELLLYERLSRSSVK